MVAVSDVIGHLPNQLPRLEANHFSPLLEITDGNRRWPALGESRVMISPERERTLLVSDVDVWGTDYFSKRLFFWSHLNLVDGVPKVNGSSTLQIREQAELQRQLYPTNHQSPPQHEKIVDFLSVAYVASGKDRPSFPDPTQLPQRANAVTELTLVDPGPSAWKVRSSQQPLVAAGREPQFIDSQLTLNTLLSGDFDPRRIVYLPPDARGFLPTNAANAHITTRLFAAHEILAEVETDAPTLVTVAQSFYHPWRAFVDGQPVKLWRANYAFQALAVPTGKHTVRLVYVDEKFRLGVGISLAGLAICGVLWWRGGRGMATKTNETLVT